jgi:2-polyprenyl-3-methyl-5-hydroxy-6-metoxy-1,4-benzoquinol methylase
MPSQPGSLGERPCPLLGRIVPSEPVPYAPAPWRLRRCLETGFVYLDNPPPTEVLIEAHAWEVSHAAESARRREAEPMRYRISKALKTVRARLRRNKMRDLAIDAVLARGAARTQVLDVGCGDGGLLVELMDSLAARGAATCAPYGIDLSRALAARADERLRRFGGQCLHAAALDGLGRLPVDRVDVVLLASFLEHEVRPLELLRACAARLSPGGVIIVKVPNYASLNRLIRGARWCGFRWPDHVNHFAPDTLRAMADAAGLRVLRSRWVDRLPFSDSLYAVLGR